MPRYTGTDMTQTLSDNASQAKGAEEERPLFVVDDLAVSFPVPKEQRHRDGRERFMAVNGVKLSIYPRQTLAVVGESGCGKSVSAMSALQLVPMPPGKLERGRIDWTDEKGKTVDLLALDGPGIRKVRGNEIAMIFQEPMTSLNPVYTIGEQILEAVLLHQQVSRKQAIGIAEKALRDVGIADPAQRLKEYPHQLSGGMRQRVMIAMALACEPELLLADEPTTALDVTIQAQILELLKELQVTRGMAIMLITHDLGVVAENADVVAVMYAGRVVEYGSVFDVFKRPLAPYTRGLLASMPILGDRGRKLLTVTEGANVPDDFPEGYDVPHHEIDTDRTSIYADMSFDLYEVEPNHWVLCRPKDGNDQAKRTRPDLPFRRHG